MPIKVKETDYDDEKWWACYTNRLGYVQRKVYMQRECDFEPWEVATENNPKFCEMCGRSLCGKDGRNERRGQRRLINWMMF